MNYKYLRLKIIVPSIIVVLLIIFVISFFAGGLSETSLSVDNIEWDDEGFLELTSQLEGSTTVWKIDGRNLETERVVTETEDYVLMIDEDTTILTVYKKGANWIADFPTMNATAVYSTAIAGSSKIEDRSNIVLYSYDKNGKLGAALPSYSKSVAYYNTLQGRTEKHYQIRYNTDGSVDVLYVIGDFNNLLETFPMYYERETFYDLFVGNTVLYQAYGTAINKPATVIDKETGETLDEEAYEITYNDVANVLDNEVALYMIKNNLCTTMTYESTTSGNIYSKRTVTSPLEDDSEVLECVDGYWVVSGLFDEDGKYKLINGVNYNCAGSPIRVNPFLNGSMLGTVFSNDMFPLKQSYTEQENGSDVIKYYNTSNWEFTENSSPCLELKANTRVTSNRLYNFLCVGGSYVTDSGLTILEKHQFMNSEASGVSKDKPIYVDYNQDGIIDSSEFFQYGGYQDRDAQGNYLFIDDDMNLFYFDANGNRVLNDENGEPQIVNSTADYKPMQAALTKEMTEEQNEAYSVTGEAESKAFQICLRFTLTDKGLDIAMLNEALIEGVGKDNTDEEIPSYFKHDNLLGKIEICRTLTTNSDSASTGQIIIPDGSGAIISFNSPKGDQYAKKYSEQRIYGNDSSIMMDMMGDSVQNIMFPMYGFLEQSLGKGLVAIVDKGAAQTSIQADVKRVSVDYNYAYFTSYLREEESVRITSTTSYTKVSEKVYPGDIIYKFHFLTGSDLTYVDVAKDYREYLIEKYELEEKDTTVEGVPTISFLGAYEKKTIKLGFVTNSEFAMTTFAQASEIVDELTEKGVTSMNVSYQLWTDDEGQQPTTTDVDVSSALGGRSDLIEFSNALKEKGYNLFLDYNVAEGAGYDLMFGTLKYNAKSISGARASTFQYVLSTGAVDANGFQGSYISPAFYNSLLLKYLKNYNKLEVSGIYLNDLGNMSIADYTKSRQIYTSVSAEYQRDALKVAKDSDKVVMLNKPYDYAFSYVDVANNVPVTTTLYPIVDYSIPLYQLVVSGLFDYTIPEVNYNNDYTITWNLLKAIETGSNLAFSISAEDTNDLLDTYYTWAYNSYYANWKENIIYMNNVLNSTGIYKGHLVSHEILTDSVVKVTYSNGLEIIINYGNENYNDLITGFTAKSNWYTIIKEGE